MVTFGQLLTVLLLLACGGAIGAALGVFWARSRPRDEAGTPEVVADQLTAAHQSTALHRAEDRALVADGLERLAGQLQALEHERLRWQGEFTTQVQHVAASNEHLRRETQALGDALRKPQVRGRWGEMHLRRTVELAGLVNHCDFTEQTQFADGRYRPDLVVHLAGGRNVVVDSKVPLDAYADAARADAAEVREGQLARHARQVRTHIDQLSSKAYWKQVDSPEFVVLFLPAEPFLSAALDADPMLVEHAAGRNVVLATPTTLIALLRTVAHGWAHETLTEQAEAVQVLGRELHSRLSILGGHVDQVGRALGKAVDSYNKAVGSLESRVLVTARKFQEMGVSSEDLAGPQQVAQHPRGLSAPEWDALEQVGAGGREPSEPDLFAAELLDPPPARHPDATRDAS